MQVFAFPAVGGWTCSSSSAADRAFRLAVPRKFATRVEHLAGTVSRPLDPRKVPRDERAIRRRATQRDSSSSIERVSPRVASINLHFDSDRPRRPRPENARWEHGTVLTRSRTSGWAHTLAEYSVDNGKWRIPRGKTAWISSPE